MRENRLHAHHALRGQAADRAGGRHAMRRAHQQAAIPRLLGLLLLPPLGGAAAGSSAACISLAAGRLGAQ